MPQALPTLRRLCPYALAASAMLAPACAADLPPVYINNLAPFSYEEQGVMKGVIYDLISEIASRAGTGNAVNPMPFKRITARLSEHPEALAAVWRQPENEANYTWIAKLLDERMMLVASRDSHVDIASIDAARHLRAGVVLGSPADVIAHRLGFEHIEAVASAESNARKLAAGHIAVWPVVPGGDVAGGQIAGIAFGAGDGLDVVE